MRRALLLAAIAVPAVTLAQADAPRGAVIDIDNFNVAAGTSYLNAAQCRDGANVNLEWQIITLSGATAGLAGNYRIYASDVAPPTAGDATVANFCPESATTEPEVNAGLVGTFAVETAGTVQGAVLSGGDIADLASPSTGRECNEGKEVFVCAHLYDTNSTKAGHASGKFIVQVEAPAAPSNVSAAVGDTRLEVSWDASSGGAVTADRYVVVARAVDANDAPVGPEITTDEITATRTTISGLTNVQRYRIVVRALSIGGNPSPDSAAAFATPQPVNDFWETYEGAGGREGGGCGTGGAGAVAVLAVAGLLAALRRRS